MANNNGQNNKQNIKPVDSVNNSRSIGDLQENITPFNSLDNTSNTTSRKNAKYKNLDILSADEARKRGRAGGLKSGEVRKARKTMRETILEMISREVDPDKLQEMGVDIESLGGDFTYQAAIIAAMLREAVNGDTKAMALLRDTMGEQPTIRQEITETITREDAQLMDNLTKALIG